MAGISDKALNKQSSKNKFNGGSELEENGINLYSTFYRQYDPQIGRFSGVDILSEKTVGLSAYQFGINNPVSFNDPMGDHFAFMDYNGNKWHHQDLMLGTAMQGQQYQEGFGWDGFGDILGANGGGGGSITFTNEGLYATGSAARAVFGDIRYAYNNSNYSGDWAITFGQNKNGFYSETPIESFDVNHLGDVIGRVDLLVYRQYLGEGSTINVGWALKLGYKDYGSGYYDFNWVQYSKTDYPINGHKKNEWFNDKSPDQKSDLPYYYAMSDLPLVSNQEGYTIMFGDIPNRPITDMYWTAQLSLVVENPGTDRYLTLTTFTYGFSYSLTNGFGHQDFSQMPTNVWPTFK